MLMRNGLAGALGDRMCYQQEKKALSFQENFKCNGMSLKQTVTEC